MQNICILDYGSGNVKSVLNAFSKYADCRISNAKIDVINASHLILPGVGTYKDAMHRILNTLPLQLIRQQVHNGKPILGICVGMQVLSSKGIEFEEAPGLGLIPGIVSRIESAGLPLPHVGWNNLTNLANHEITAGISEEDDFYFVHSYAYSNISREFVNAEVEYGVKCPAIISRGNIIGVQFHPEQSQKAGDRVIQNFLGIK